MATSNIYLTFDGNCEEAMTFYAKVFDTQLENVMHFSDMPVQEGMPPMPEEILSRVSHSGLPISAETRIMASDAAPNWGPPFQLGNNFSIYMNFDSPEEADKIFAALSEGGEVTMPMSNMFWGSYFGTITDQFGVQWMVNYDLPGGS